MKLHDGGRNSQVSNIIISRNGVTVDVMNGKTVKSASGTQTLHYTLNY